MVIVPKPGSESLHSVHPGASSRAMHSISSVSTMLHRVYSAVDELSEKRRTRKGEPTNG
jgi:hypothetical protein